MRTDRARDGLQLMPAGLEAGGGASTFAAGGFAQGPYLLAPPMPGEDLAVCMTTDRVWGILGARETVTVEVNGGQMGASLADDVGFFWTTLYDYDDDGDRPNLDVGDAVAIYHNGAQAASVTLRSISGQIDVVNDIVTGTIGGAGLGFAVTVYVGSPEPSMTSYSQVVSTDGSGYFTADFSGVFDLNVWHEAMITYEDSGVGVHKHVYPANTLLVRPVPWNGVRGTAPPGTPVTVTLYHTDMTDKESDTVKAADIGGWYSWDPVTDVLPTDIVVVALDDGETLTRTVGILDLTVDAVNDQLTGHAEPGTTVRAVVGELTEDGWHDVNATAASDGDYLIDFSGIVDIMPGQWAGVLVADNEGDDLSLWNHAPSVEVNATLDDVSGAGPADPGPASEGKAVTITFASTSTVFHAPLDWWGFYKANRDDYGLPDIVPGEVVTVEMDGYMWQGVVEVEAITAGADLELDLITGTVTPPSDRVEVSGRFLRSEFYPVAGAFDTFATASSDFGAEPAGFDVNYDLFYDVSHRTGDDYVNRISLNTDAFGMMLPFNAVIGRLAPPGTPFTITLKDSEGSVKDERTGISQEPDASTGFQQYGGEGPSLEAGDRLQVQSGAGYSVTSIVPDFVVSPDLASNLVYGSGPANWRFFFEVEGQGGGFVSTRGDGSYAFAVDQLQDAQEDAALTWGSAVNIVSYIDENRTWVWDQYRWPQVVASYDMEGRNEVWGQDALPGSSIYITVSHPVSGVIETGTAVAGACEWCGPGEYQLDVPGGTLEPGNTVTVNFGSDLLDSMIVHDVSAEANASTDVVTVTTEPGTYAFINADGPSGDWDWWWSHDEALEVGPSGVVVFDLSGEYDIVPGTRFNVHVEQEHAHQTHYAFWLPAPELGIDKWNTSGHASPGGLVVYGVHYWNWGNGDASDTLVVDTLPLSTTWAGDTSGFPHVEAGGVITWNLGTVAPNEDHVFAVTLDVLPSVVSGTLLPENCTSITTATPGDWDPGNNSWCSDSVDVWDDEVEMGIDKWTHPGDPTPGQEFEYQIDVCNNRGAATGPLRLTDTLPVSAIFLSWRPDDDWSAFWNEVSASEDEIVLEAPGFPGDSCDRLQFRVALDASAIVGESLCNAIEMQADGDVEPDNNYRDHCTQISEPRYDMDLDKSFNWGVLVPGGEIDYGIAYENRGNHAVHAWLTDTLPAGTSYQEGSAGTGGWGWWEPFEPMTVTSEYLVWDLGEVEVSERVDLNFRLDVSQAVAPNTILDNCAEVGIKEAEDTPGDNTECVATTVYTAGRPNLFVDKWLEHYDPGNDHMSFRIRFGNLGDQPVHNVHLTDTFPIGATYNWHSTDWDGSEFTETVTADQFEVVFQRIEPGRTGELQLSLRLDDPREPLRWYTNTIQIDVPPGDANPGDNFHQAAAFSGGEVSRVELNVYQQDIWGEVPQGPITITTHSSQTVLPWDGGFDWGAPEPILPGDTITVEAGAGAQPVVIVVPDPFDAYASSITDTVWGQIDHLDHEWVQVDLDNGPSKEVEADGNGNFSASFGDIPRGGRGEIRYDTTIDYTDVTFHRRFQTADLVVTVDYDDDWVNGYYEADHTLWLTVTESGGWPDKAWAQLTTGPIDDWGGESGFQTRGEDWTPQDPDIQPGDTVRGLIRSRAYTTTVEVGTIDAEVDVSADTVFGTIHAPWPADEDLTVRCEIHEEDGEGIEIQSVSPDGGTFFCDFAGRWDIVPGQNVAVNYTEPDGDMVQAHPANPAPHVRIEKWAESEPGVGGNFAFRIQYRNEGDADAENTVITDTLQGGTYINDTSGLPHTGSGSGPIVWDVGTLPPSDWIQFDVLVHVTAVEGEFITNTATITASNDMESGDPGEKYAESSRQVQGNDTHLSVGKQAWTGDPAPGQNFVWNVNVCNDGSTGSSKLTLTDTLPISTTLLEWWGREPGWSGEYEDPAKLVLSRPSISGWSCNEVYLRFSLDADAQPGMAISNTATITASNDMENDDNETTHWVWVSEPHTNVSIRKWFGGGQLVPGGEIYYDMAYHNDGNAPVSGVFITDTLPTNTSLLRLRSYDQDWNEIGEVTPSEPNPGVLMWEIGSIDNGEGGHFRLELNVDPPAGAGDLLTNTVELTRLPGEDDFKDNESTWIEELYESGPNLRVHKSGWWHDWGEDTRQVQFDVEVENVGDERVDWVTITDTYPIEMYMNGGVDVGGLERWWDWRDNPDTHSFTVTLEYMHPGERMGFHFTVITDTSPMPPGRILTNTVEVTLLPDDRNSEDNVDKFAVTSGPDLWVKKKLTEAELLPGEVITYSLAFGNAGENWQGPWNLQGNAWLTDTLPAELEFVTSTLHWCGPTDWCPVPPNESGNQYSWQLWPLGAGEWNEIQLVARISDAVEDGDDLTNTAEISSDNPAADVEPRYGNNSDSTAVSISLPKFEVGKTFESEQAAGGVVTYTLTVTNTGSAEGTNIILSDTVPVNLTHVGTDGMLAGGDITWNYASIAAHDGTASGWFSGTLPCAGAVTNDNYRAVSSDQGVASADGEPVSLTTVAPALSASFDLSAESLDLDQTVYFTDTSTTNGGMIAQWAWDFGDGDSGTGRTTSHAYDAQGAFTVTLTITDTCGYSDTEVVESAVTVALNRVYLPLLVRNH
jgi:uncharacterized repeat protein (TIGR01451 family)